MILRFIVSRKTILDDLVARPLAEQQDTILQWCGDNIDIGMRPCNGKESLSFLVVLPATETLSNG